jgi:hypothetical protein
MKRSDCPENEGRVSSKTFYVKPNIPKGFANSDFFQKLVCPFANTAVCMWAKH